MVTTSSYPQVVTSLMTNLPDVMPAGTEVLRGAPMKYMANDNVLIGGMEKGSQTFPVSRSGRKPRDEQYELIININCIRRGVANPATAETAALAIFSALGSYIADDPTLETGYPTLRAHISEFEMDSFVEDTGWRTIMVVRVMVEVRLT